MRLLVIEDDRDLNRQLTAALEHAGYAVDTAFDGEEGHFLGDTEPYDGVILDMGLPKMDGIRVLEKWRREGRKMPVLILTARDRWSEKVQGFDAGADDYVTKPFHMEEVLARLRACCGARRAMRRASSPAASDPRYAFEPRGGGWEPDPPDQPRVPASGLSDAPSGRVVSRTELVEHLYDQDFDRDSNTIEVFIGRLRKKLGVDVIETVRGLGYIAQAPALRLENKVIPCA